MLPSSRESRLSFLWIIWFYQEQPEDILFRFAEDLTFPLKKEFLLYQMGGKAPDLLYQLQKKAVKDFEEETGYKTDILD